ncbi:prolactin regulatory element-binding protein [Rhodotorula toruloides]|uniref:Prolactin regulatory element-binding protein n=1 Tax=Rhodotorula toruloides TaxID=5286 RepID=A0A511KRK1_RHOTO|nr:prolactin regulatory element-binding protein [Rhodotorula toruloides]
MPADPTPTTLTAEPGSSSKAHFPLDAKFPVYAIVWMDDSTVLLAGGGGSSRTGVKNRISMYAVDPKKRQLSLVTQHELSKEEDAPMTMAIDRKTKALVAGINSSADQLEKGVNENLRVFSYDANSIKYEKRKQTFTSVDPDHYQKVTAFSRSTPPLLAAGSTDSQISLVAYPELEDVLPTLQYDKEEIYDADFNDAGDMLVGTSSNKLCVWSTKVADKEATPEPLQVIERPVLKKELACTFRAAKFGRAQTASNLYTVVNASPATRVRKPPAGSQKAFVSLWDARAWKLLKTRTVSQKPVTAFDVSEDGTLLAYGSSDLSVGILDAVTLRPILTVLHAHDFPVTSLKFNPSASILISGSADNSVRVIEVPSLDQRGGNSTTYTVLFTLLILILAILIQMTFGEDLLRAARAIL